MACLLKKVVDAEHWDAEGIAGRLGIVAHAAFLRAGFVPCRTAPSSGHLLLKRVDEIGPSAPWLSRRYTAPQLVARGEEEGAAAVEVAVLEMRAQGDGDVAFQAYLLTRGDDGHRRRCLCEALLDGEAHLAPILSGGLDDAARALETTGSWLWKSVADWVCRVLFLVLCRRNGLPVTGLLSLPDDAKAEILRRLPDGKDLARVECSSRLLRGLVAERDGELWKAMYETLDLMPEPEEDESLDDLDAPPAVALTWKERYVHALAAQQRPSSNSLRYFEELLATMLPRSYSTYEHLDAMDMHVPSRWELSMEDYYFPFNMEPIEEHMDFYVPPYLVLDPPPAAAAPEVVVRSRQFSGRHRKVPQKYPKKRHGAGATHSPSSRYRWRYR